MTIATPAKPVPLPVAFDGLTLTRTSAAPHREDVGQPSSLLTQALDALEDGLILTNAQSTMIYANRAARAIFASGGLTVRQGVICAATCLETKALQRAIAGRAQDVAAAFLRLSVPGARRHLMLTVTTADGRSEGFADPTVLVLVRDGRRAPPPSARMIGTFFNLTPAEARLACEMIKGDGLKACANRLGITPNTARTHLNRVFDKTGTNRQAELVRLLLSCRCSFGGEGAERAA